MRCPSGHDLEAVIPGVYLCDPCDLVFARSGDTLVWEACPHVNALAREVVGLRQEAYLLREAAEDALAGDTSFARVVLDPDSDIILEVPDGV